MTAFFKTTAIWFMLMGNSNPSSANFEVDLSQIAKEEMGIINRIGLIRKATERLPESWKTESAGEDGAKRTYVKADILNYLSQLELTTAKRWEVLIQNTATLNIEDQRLPEKLVLVRQDLKKMPSIHQRIHSNLDRINELLKDGILLNLANQISVSKEVN